MVPGAEGRKHYVWGARRAACTRGAPCVYSVWGALLVLRTIRGSGECEYAEQLRVIAVG